MFHNNTSVTPEALPAILEGLKKKGYKIVPISELIRLGDYKVDHAGRQMPVGEVKNKETVENKIIEY